MFSCSIFMLAKEIMQIDTPIYASNKFTPRHIHSCHHESPSAEELELVAGTPLHDTTQEMLDDLTDLHSQLFPGTYGWSCMPVREDELVRECNM